MTASMRMASSSGVHLEFSFNRLSPRVVDIGERLLEREGGGEGLRRDWGLVWAFVQEPLPDIYGVVSKIGDGEKH